MINDKDRKLIFSKIDAAYKRSGGMRSSYFSLGQTHPYRMAHDINRYSAGVAHIPVEDIEAYCMEWRKLNLNKIDEWSTTPFTVRCK